MDSISFSSSSNYAVALAPIEPRNASLASEIPQKPSDTIFQKMSGKAALEDTDSNAATNENAPLEDKEAEAEKQAILSQLSSRDREVRAHEQAHVAAGGTLITHGAQFSFQVGPDGKRYAVGGEVGIDTSAVSGDPSATLQKAMTIQRAALAPANPSAQDMAVAAQAQQMANEARAELSSQQGQEESESVNVSENSSPTTNTSYETKDTNDISIKQTQPSRATSNEPTRLNEDQNTPNALDQNMRNQFELRMILQ